MADLIIDALAASGAAGRRPVRIELTDADGNPVVGYTADGAVIDPSQERTDRDGHLLVDLTPNADIDPTGTCYTVTVGEEVFRVLKTSAEQTLFEALVAGPLPLGPVVGATGPQGEQGEPGIQGPPGDSGSGGLDEAEVDARIAAHAYTHVQSVPSTGWVVNHGLGRHPVATPLDTSGREFLAEVNHVDVNTLTVSTLTALAGVVECR